MKFPWGNLGAFNKFEHTNCISSWAAHDCYWHGSVESIRT